MLLAESVGNGLVHRASLRLFLLAYCVAELPPFCNVLRNIARVCEHGSYLLSNQIPGLFIANIVAHLPTIAHFQ